MMDLQTAAKTVALYEVAQAAAKRIGMSPAEFAAAIGLIHECSTETLLEMAARDTAPADKETPECP